MKDKDFEKLGAFYLGRELDVDSGETKDEPLLYDAKDLCTHGVCVGMTGSGKTGLCIGLLEEAAIDGVPALVIDPKGDMGNLMLTFPQLRPEDFEPWIDPGEATREGMDVGAYAARTAKMWREGIASWGQGPDRIRRLKNAAEVAIYTPGSTAGLPLTVLRSFAAPPAALLEDSEAFGDKVQSAVAGLLALMGADTDPVKSRDFTLLSNIVHRAWGEGRDLELADLIREIQDPPFKRLGVLDLESFYPAKERASLAMSLNNLLASPTFAPWLEGEALDVGKLLYTPEGKPRIAILSIAHLSDAERMFFVTILLNEVVAWMRAQPGTSSLRALLYMDEIFGYFPPTAEPPSKRPMLTLLKQARAFGVGVLLATQNPVDLDYKGLSNTGTWFIGRLQTERDKLRVLDGLEGAMSSGGKTFDRGKLDRTLSGLSSRVFLMNNVHEDAPVVFNTRWVLSYLRGPLTRTQIKTLMARPAAARKKFVAARTERVPREEARETKPERPSPPAGIKERFLPLAAVPGSKRLVYRPALFTEARLHYALVRANVDLWRQATVRAPLGEEPEVDWDAAEIREREHDQPLTDRPEPEATFAPLPAPALNKKKYATWGRRAKSHVYEKCALTVYKCKELKLVSAPDESEGEFRGRVQLAAREARDQAIEKLRRKYAPKLATSEDRIRRAKEKVGKEKEDVAEKKKTSWFSTGASLLGALLGRKLASATNVRRAGSAAKAASRVKKEKADVQRAKRALEAEREKLQVLEERLEEDVAELKVDYRPADYEFEEIVIRPRKSDITMSAPMLVWRPWAVDESGIAEPMG
ncbi:MAG: ATP-binding protein [bacterium]|nr:ATP-binding protein [bacterium]